MFMYLLSPFIVQSLKKKSIVQIQSFEDAPFSGLKGPICPKNIFFRKPINTLCSFHSCISTFQTTESDINPLMKYWSLKYTEISLARSIFGRNLRTRLFLGI